MQTVGRRLISGSVKAGKPWHIWYRDPTKGKLYEHYRGTIIELGAVRQINESIINDLRENVKNKEKTMELWRDICIKLKIEKSLVLSNRKEQKATLIEELKETECQPIGQRAYNLKVILRVLSQIAQDWKVDSAEFIMFWESIAKDTELAIELIPGLMRYYCQRGRFKRANEVLHRLADGSKNSILYKLEAENRRDQLVGFRRGLNNGLNMLLYHYSFEYQEIKSPRWRKISDTLEGYNGDIGIRLFPAVAQHLHTTVPKTEHVQFFKLLLGKNANMRTKSMIPFLRSVFWGSDMGRELVINTDRMLQEISEEARARVHENRPPNTTNMQSKEPIFHKDMYRHIMKALTQRRRSREVAWILENIIMHEPVSIQELNIALKQVLAWTVETETVGMVGQLYEKLLNKGMAHDREVLFSLFRCFRLHGLEDKCYEMMDTMRDVNIIMDRNISIELMQLVSARYDIMTVMETFASMFDEGKAIAETLGLVGYVQDWQVKAGTGRGYDGYEKVRGLRVNSAQVNQTALMPALDLVYKAVLGTITNKDTILHLFDNFYMYQLTHPLKLDTNIHIVDTFVEALLRLSSPDAVDAAHALFKRAMSQLKVPRSVAKIRTCKSLGILVKAYCSDKTVSGRYPDVRSAIEIVRMAVKLEFLPITRTVLEPIVRYYGKIGDSDKEQAWREMATKMGAVLMNRH